MKRQSDDPPSYASKKSFSMEQSKTATHTVWLEIAPYSKIATILIDDTTTFTTFQCRLRELHLNIRFAPLESRCYSDGFTWSSWLYLTDKYDPVFIGENNWAAIKPQLIQLPKADVQKSKFEVRYPRLTVQFDDDRAWREVRAETPEQLERLQRRFEANEGEMLVQGRYLPPPTLCTAKKGCEIM